MRAGVIGHIDARRLRVTPAVAPGWRAVYAAGKPYPVLVRARGNRAPGLVAEGAGPGSMARLDAFERGYRRARIVVEAGGRAVAAQVYLPLRRLRAGFRPFLIGPWRQRHKTDYLKRIRRAGR